MNYEIDLFKENNSPIFNFIENLQAIILLCEIMFMTHLS